MVVETEESLLLVPHGPLQVVDVGVGDHVVAGHQAEGGPALPRSQSQAGARAGGRGGRRRGETDRVVVVVVVVVVVAG